MIQRTLNLQKALSRSSTHLLKTRSTHRTLQSSLPTHLTRARLGLHNHGTLSRSISALQKYKPGFVLGKLKKIMRSRAAIYKILFIAGTVQIGYFSIRNYMASSTTILTVKDLLSREDIKDDDNFELVSRKMRK